jgi:hypothetical protein
MKPSSVVMIVTLMPLLAVPLLAADDQILDRRKLPSNMALKLIGRIDVDHSGLSAIGLTIVGNYVYVTAWDGGLNVVDVSNPSAPKKVGSCTMPGEARDVAVSGGFAFVAAQEGGLRVVDVSNPKSPIEVGSYRPQPVVRSGKWGPVVEAVAVAGKYAYVVYNYVPKGKDKWYGILRVLDISNPKVPTELGSFESSGLFLSVALSGKYAYVADKSGSLHVVDVSDPNAPAEFGSCHALGEPQGVTVAGKYAYVSDDDGGMHVVDISNPKAPKHVGSFEGAEDTPGVAEAVAIAGNYAFVASDFGSLYALDVSDPRFPRHVATYRMKGPAVGVIVAGDFVYVNVWRGGLFVLKLTEKGRR